MRAFGENYWKEGTFLKNSIIASLYFFSLRLTWLWKSSLLIVRKWEVSLA